MTKMIFSKELLEFLKISSPSHLRNILFRAVSKGCLSVFKSKSGPNASRVFKIEKKLFTQLSHSSKRGDFIVDPLANPLASNGSSSSIILTTTIPICPDQKFNEKWGDLDFSDLSEIGFSKNHLLQLADKKNLTAESVQGSIHHFAYGLRHTDKVKKYDNPLNVLMGVLCKGQAWIELSYKSKQELAQELLLNQKLKSQARLKKLREQAYDIALDDWIDGLSKPQLEAIAPEKKARGDFMPQKIKLGLHFREQVWPTVQQEYLAPD